MKYDILIQRFFLLLITIVVIIFAFSPTEHHLYSNPFWVNLIEFSFLTVLIVKNKFKNINIFIFIFLAFGIFNSYNPNFDLKIYLIALRLVIYFTFLTTALKFKFNPIPFYVLLTLSYLISYFRGIAEPGLFIEFNLECILWLTLVVKIESSLKTKRKLLFVLFNLFLLFLWKANAALLALMVIQVLSFKKKYWVIIIGLVILMINEYLSEIMLIDRVKYILAYIAYVNSHMFEAFIPMSGINLPYETEKLFELYSPRYLEDHGVATSVLFHSYILRVLYDLGFVFSFIFTFSLIKKLIKNIEFKYVIIFIVLGLSTNSFYGSFALFSMAFIDNKKIKNKK